MESHPVAQACLPGTHDPPILASLGLGIQLCTIRLAPVKVLWTPLCRARSSQHGMPVSTYHFLLQFLLFSDFSTP